MAAPLPAGPSAYRLLVGCEGSPFAPSAATKPVVDVLAGRATNDAIDAGAWLDALDAARGPSRSTSRCRPITSGGSRTTLVPALGSRRSSAGVGTHPVSGTTTPSRGRRSNSRSSTSVSAATVTARRSIDRVLCRRGKHRYSFENASRAQK